MSESIVNARIVNARSIVENNSVEEIKDLIRDLRTGDIGRLLFCMVFSIDSASKIPTIYHVNANEEMSKLLLDCFLAYGYEFLVCALETFSGPCFEFDEMRELKKDKPIEKFFKIVINRLNSVETENLYIYEATHPCEFIKDILVKRVWPDFLNPMSTTSALEALSANSAAIAELITGKVPGSLEYQWKRGWLLLRARSRIFREKSNEIRQAFPGVNLGVEYFDFVENYKTHRDSAGKLEALLYFQSMFIPLIRNPHFGSVNMSSAAPVHRIPTDILTSVLAEMLFSKN